MTTDSILQTHLEHFEKLTHGKIGISAHHIETGKQIHFRDKELFLMCSTYKIPIVVTLLQQVEQGKINLNQDCELTEDQLRPGMTTFLNQLDYSKPVIFSVINLLKLMLQDSDNTASDIILNLVGGPSSIMQMLESVGIQDMRIDRSTLEVMADWDGIKNLPKDHRCTLQQYKLLEQAINPNEISQIRTDFLKDVRDRSTSRAMMELLVKIFRHEVISPEHSQLLLKIMRRCRTGQNRLMGLLPQNTPVAHKTGTITGHTHDVGIITLPHNKGHFAIAVYIEDIGCSPQDNERVIAEVARTIYDFFLFQN